LCPYFVRDNWRVNATALELVRSGFEAASRGDVGSIVTFRDGLIADMAVYPAADEAVAAAGGS
jgi:hypothetical protein